MMGELLFYVALWGCGYVFGWAMHRRDWRKAYIVENENLRRMLGDANARVLLDKLEGRSNV